jgi:TonB family protein
MIAFILKVTLCWLFFYGIYELFLKNKTFFNANRSYLLITLFAGIALPLLEFIPWKNESNVAYVIYPMLMEIDDLQAVVATKKADAFNWLNLLYVLYGIGFLISGIRFSLGISKIVKLYKRSEKKNQNTYVLVLTDQLHLPFSFFKWVFFSKKMTLTDEVDRILEHEIEHIKGRHSFDVLATEMLKVIFWCSPMIYLYKNALKEVHEFLADNVVVKNTDKISYKRLLLNQTNNGLQMALTHQFFNSHLKNRLKMISQKRSGRPTLVMYALGIPVLLLLLFAFTYSYQGESLLVETKVLEDISQDNLNKDARPLKQNDRVASTVFERIDNRFIPLQDTVPVKVGKATTYKEEIFKVVEEMPRFPGCEDEGSRDEKENCAKQKMLEHIYKNLKYPKADKDNGIEGMAVVQFVVSKTGEIRDVKMVRSLSSTADAEVVRVTQAMNELSQKWTPGIQRGQAVNVMYTLPVRFKLQDKEVEKENIQKTSGIVKGELVEEENNSTFELKTGTNNLKGETLSIRTSDKDNAKPIIYIDGELFEGELDDIDPENIEGVSVFKGEKAVAKYGAKGENGVVEIALKDKSQQPAKKVVTKTILEVEGKVQPLFVVDGEIREKGLDEELDPETIAKINVLKGEAAKEKYGDRGLNGVVEITTKEKSEQSIEKPAYWPGCGDLEGDARTACSNKNLMEYVARNLKYSKEASKKGIEGMVVTSFTIGKDGKVKNIGIKKEVEGLNQSAIDLLEKMRSEITWEPAMKDGKAVDMELKLPIRFKLPANKKVESVYSECEAITDVVKREKCKEEKALILKKTLENLDSDTREIQLLNLDDVSVYPNPARETVNISFKAAAIPTTIQLIDIDGKLIKDLSDKNFNGTFAKTIDISSFATKLVLLRVEQEGKIFTEKIIIE